MIGVLSRAEMRAFDAGAIDACAVPSLVLMENAGRGATDVIERECLGGEAAGAIVAIVCGTGNNGGDGFVVARHLLTRGAAPLVFCFGDEARFTRDARANHDAYVGLGGVVSFIPKAPGAEALEALDEALSIADVVVDAVLGTGLDRSVDGPLAELLARMSRASGRRVALDVPSGMDADRGAALGAAFEADVTVTFAHAKLGHLTGAGARLCGAVHVVDIGVPPRAAERAGAVPVDAGVSAWLVERRDVVARLPRRAVDAHKYRAGHVAILGGSRGKIGAPLMTAQAALRAGAGAATIVTWDDVAPAIEARAVEGMTQRLRRGASLEGDVDAALAGKRVVVAGPGLGTDADARAAVLRVLSTFDGIVVLDADALTCVAGALDLVAAAKGDVLLTPHAGELARLLGASAEALEADRFASARDAASRARAAVLSKGPHTIVAAPDGRVAVNATGNPLLATAGSGDVLAGIAGALGCACPAFDAGWCAAWLHGAAADAWRERRGDTGMLAHELAEALPDVLRALRGGG